MSASPRPLKRKISRSYSQRAVRTRIGLFYLKDIIEAHGKKNRLYVYVHEGDYLYGGFVPRLLITRWYLEAAHQRADVPGEVDGRGILEVWADDLHADWQTAYR